MKTHDARLDEARRKHNAAVSPLFQEKQRLENEVSQKRGIVNQLKASAPAEFEERFATLDDQARPIVKRLDWIHDTIGVVTSGDSRRCLEDEQTELDSQMTEINRQRDVLARESLTA